MTEIEEYHDGCRHLNLAANVCGYTPVSLGKIIKKGILADIDSIHRQTINKPAERKQLNRQPYDEPHMVPEDSCRMDKERSGGK